MRGSCRATIECNLKRAGTRTGNKINETLPVTNVARRFMDFEKCEFRSVVRETHGQVPDHDADVTMSSKPSVTFLDGNMSIVCQNQPSRCRASKSEAMATQLLCVDSPFFTLTNFQRVLRWQLCGAKAA